MPKHICLNCHFLMSFEPQRITLSNLDPKQQFESVTTEDRLTFLKSLTIDKTSDERWRILEPTTMRIKSLACAQGVWREHQLKPGRVESTARSSALEQILEVDRQDKCYFFLYQEDMRLDTAKDLWQREYDNQKELAARELEVKKEARELAAYQEQTKRELLVQAREDQKYQEDKKFSVSQEEIAKTNLRWARIITLATALAAVAAIAQAVVAFLKP